MKIIDMHLHLGFAEPNGDIIERMDSAGVYGGCVFSAPPKEYDGQIGKDFETRLTEVLKVTERDTERLFPVMWIHPYEENILEKINASVDKGIVGFKIICSDFSVGDEKSIEVLKHIASLNKPVFFHTGILWDTQDSSKYNRPANWEAVMGIKGLRFSMGHCAWPWIDECIAVYGKFLNTLLQCETAEMFFDITPGTPEIYREELITKLFTIGYDIGENIMFGTDCNAEDYNPEWTTKWLNTDRKILDKLGVSKAVRENLYYNNFMRFLGRAERQADVKSPTTDNANSWSPLNSEVPAIIEKWYKELGFTWEYNAEFYDALKSIKISDAITVEEYDIEEKDGKRNLLSYLYFCEALKQKYEDKGISLDIFYDTIKDLVAWTEIWSGVKGELYFGETSWLKRHLKMELFKFGRLQFCGGKAHRDMPTENISEGDNVIEIHIPTTGTPMKYEDCVESIKMAKEFFAKYYPEFEYKGFTCNSWLLDTSLGEILDSNSNIMKFQSLFNIVHEEKADAIIKYTFRWNTTRKEVRNEYCTSSFAEKVKKRIVSGGDFYSGLGVIKK